MRYMYKAVGNKMDQAITSKIIPQMSIQANGSEKPILPAQTYIIVIQCEALKNQPC